jgi:uracil-DNA glycosylase
MGRLTPTVMLPLMLESIPADWRSVLAHRLDDQSLQSLAAFVARQRAESEVYPPADDVFAALRLTPFRSVRAVILGQDPYHGPGEAHGLAFSVPPGVKHPPSLDTILRELETDLGRAVPNDGSLEPWARHGVLLLNTVLTVRRGCPGSHAHRGWEDLTGAVLAAVAARPEPIVFLLWGARAREQARRYGVDGWRHIVLASTHPSPRSARRASRSAPAFVGSAPFRRANEELRARGQPPIEWDLAAP